MNFLKRFLYRIGVLRCAECTGDDFLSEPCEDCTFFGRTSCTCTIVKLCDFCGCVRARAGQLTTSVSPNAITQTER